MFLPVICALLWAAPAQTAVDGRALRGGLKSAEQLIDDRIQQTTGRTPFVLLGRTRGGYLSGYGAVFTIEVNLVPVANVSPFRPAYSPQEIQKLNREKREKLGSLKATLRQLLVDQAAQLSQVPATEKVAIVVTLFNYHWEDTSGLPSQVVMQATRQALLDLHARRAGPGGAAEAQERAIETKEF